MHARDHRWLVTTIGLWLAALATKETAVMFPVAVLLYDRWVSPGTTDDGRRRLVGLHLPLFGLATMAALARVAVFVLVEHDNTVTVHGGFALLELDVVRRYLGMFVMPGEHSIFHAVLPVSGLSDPRVLFAVLVIGALLACAWRWRRVEGLASVGIIWFFLALVPSSVLVVLDRGEAMAEHRVYVASAGLFLAAGAVSGWLVRRLSDPVPSRSLRLLQVAFVMWLVVLGGRTVVRNVLWDDPVVVWTEAANRAPDHWVPQLLLGEELQRRGRCEDAVTHFKRSVKARPEERTPHRKLGACLIELGRLGEARDAFEELQVRAVCSGSRCNMNLTRRSHGATTWPAPDAG